jgi:hypothetical protein
VPSAAVEVNRWIVLDEEDRVVEVSEDARPEFEPLLGERLWETFPDASEVFGPYCERARLTGEVVELVRFFEGTLKRVRYSPEGSRVTATWEVLAAVDVSSVENLRRSLLEMANILADSSAEGALRARPLRVLEGGAA